MTDAYPMTSRYAICAAGAGWTVEDRRTGKTCSHHGRYASALRQQRKLSEQARKDAQAVES